ncbi:hypothetical protein CRUP_011895 [Coryphaenoides rupestris]|nr:hypothetical protein CRUP_011895 [Coryphaenoides rupestris]
MYLSCVRRSAVTLVCQRCATVCPPETRQRRGVSSRRSQLRVDAHEPNRAHWSHAAPWLSPGPNTNPWHAHLSLLPTPTPRGGHSRPAVGVTPRLSSGARGLCSSGKTQSAQDTPPPPPPPAPGDSQRDSVHIPGHGLFKFKELHENPWTVPNLLCVCRIVLSPYLGYLIIHQHFYLSLALFTLAGATDLLDGYIARTWPNQQSALGSALDPLADKILISALYLSLTYAQLIPAPLTALVIFRDIGLIAAVFWVRYKTVPPPVNTAIQLFLVAASLAAPVFKYTDSPLLQSLWYITAVTTAASGYSYWHYGRKTVRVLNTKSP